MKRQKRQMLILSAILVICIAFYVLAGVYSRRQEQKELAESEDAYEVLSFSPSELSLLSVESTSASLLLSYEDGEWSFVRDINALMEGEEEEMSLLGSALDEGEEAEEGDEAKVNDEEDEEEAEVTYEVSKTSADSMVSILSSLTSAYCLADVEDLDVYGLSEPGMTITLTMTDASVHTLSFGVWNEMIDMYYYSLDNENTLYTMDSSTYYTLNRSDTDLASEVTAGEEEE